MTTTVALIALFVLCIGLAMLAANPGRLTNQVFAFGALLLGAELVIINRSFEAGVKYLENGTGDPLFWVRASAAMKWQFPWIIWMIGDSIINPSKNFITLIKTSKPCFFTGITLGIATTTNWYIPSNSLPNHISKGPLYTILQSLMIAYYTSIIINYTRKLKSQSGIRRIEMQFLVISISITALISTSLFSAGHIFNIYYYKQAAIYFTLPALSLVAFYISYYRIISTIEFFLNLLHKIGIVLFLCTITYLLQSYLSILLPNYSTPLISLSIAGITSLWLDRTTFHWLGLDGGKSHTKLRKMVIEAARAEPSRTHLVTQFEHILQTHYGSKQASFLFNQKGCYRAGEKTLQKHSAGYDSLCKIGWATPESLERRRPTPGLTELGRMLDTHGLALVCPIPRGNPEPSLLITLSTKQSSAPFTYPEIERIQNIAELMDNLLLRSQLSSQLEMQTRLESVADISRSLAHDLKNLITPVSAFLKTLENERTPHFSETPIYSAARQSIRVINDYIDEAHFFSKQLAPRIEFVEPYNLLKEAAATLQEKADRKSIRIEVLPSTTEPIYADRVLLIRLLTNLADNAIDASTSGGHINMHTERTIDGKLKFSVSDSGTGIPPDILPRIFEPYFTTKDLGNEVRGFGLGLAINQRIVDLYEGEIHVRTAVGAGTTFEVTIPQKSIQPTGSLSPAPAINSDKHPLVA